MPGNRIPTGKPRGRPKKRHPIVKYHQLEPDAKRKRQPPPLHPHERVVYPLPDSRTERAVALIDAVNNDGTATVTVCYILDEEGAYSSWLGYKDRIAQELLRRAA